MAHQCCCGILYAFKKKYSRKVFHDLCSIKPGSFRVLGFLTSAHESCIDTGYCYFNFQEPVIYFKGKIQL